MMNNNTPKNLLENVVSNLSLKRIASTEEIANSVLFFHQTYPVILQVKQ